MKTSFKLENSLKKYFNYSSFHRGQKEIIEDILSGYNVLGVLPTGAGKSLCYQLPAKLLPGTTIVVSPLISLMMDQVKELKAFRFKDAVALNSFMDWKERQHILRNLEKYSLVYVSPEFLQREQVLRQLMQIQISLFVVDEAHCVSQWGHEFRTDYLRLPSIVEKLGNPPILALSATAPDNVQQDIINHLNLKQVKKHIHPIDRPNIALVVEDVNDDHEKIDRITEIVQNRRIPTVIYLLSRKKSEEIASLLSNRLLDKRIAFYHGGMKSIDRISVQQQFMNDQLDIICCTSAFGMGINKPNIRLIIHFHLPVQIESFIQEIGRAGRDGKESVSLSFFSGNDIHLSLSIIEQELPTEPEIKYVIERLYELFLEEKQLPENDEHLEELFQLNNTQVRFLTYQLEKHGMIKHKTISYDKQLWEQAYNKINNFKNERLLSKQRNLTKMMNWIQTNTCLRKSLYELLQPSYTPLTKQCCSRCQFTFTTWHPVEAKAKYIEPISWREKLASLLLIGDHHETRRLY